MRALLLALLLPCAAWAQEVARVFGTPVTAAQVNWKAGEPPAQAARQLRELVLKEVTPRFIAQHKLEATPEEVAAYARWEAEFKRGDEQRRRTRLEQLERELAAGSADPKKREERDLLLRLRNFDGQLPPPSPQVHAWWIEAFKLKKALYEKYGGRVGITKWGPDPVGATEALLREHERRGELVILEAALAREFWESLAREPRMPATKPEHIDFTYFWLKPPVR